MKLLSLNTKLLKDSGANYAVRGLSLAPHSIGGHNVCPDATAGCRSSCVLWFTGRTVTRSVREAMIRRKDWLLRDRTGFEAQLCHEIELFAKWCARFKLLPAVRLNVASDLDWSHIASMFPMIRFYDYTKVRSRLLNPLWPHNYALTLSRSERTHHRTMGAALRRGRNVACVFDTRYWPQGGRIDPLPDSWRIDGTHWPIVDGDKHDVRLPELDGRGVIVGLRFKGSLKRRAAAVRKGFALCAS